MPSCNPPTRPWLSPPFPPQVQGAEEQVAALEAMIRETQASADKAQKEVNVLNEKVGQRQQLACSYQSW